MSFDDRQWTTNERRMLRCMLETDGMQFMRYIFGRREGTKLLLNWHHYLIDYVLQGVLDCKINRLIINLAPGYTKTEQVVLAFISRAMAIYPRSRFIHASYSGDLALENSLKIRETVLSHYYQELWPVEIMRDAKSKRRWFTSLGGGMLASPAGGQITGYRAGRMEPNFTGAFIIDDPLKPDDAYSDARRTTINNRFNNTMRSRLANENVPMIVVMQRIHTDDMTGYLLKGGSGDYWHHLSIPTSFNESNITGRYSDEYTHGIPIDINAVLTAMNDGVHLDF